MIALHCLFITSRRHLGLVVRRHRGADALSKLVSLLEKSIAKKKQPVSRQRRDAAIRDLPMRYQPCQEGGGVCFTHKMCIVAVTRDEPTKRFREGRINGVAWRDVQIKFKRRSLYSARAKLKQCRHEGLTKYAVEVQEFVSLILNHAWRYAKRCDLRTVI